jgi:hypothetical protein
MPPLRELQSGFMDALLSGNPSRAAALLAERSAAAEGRLRLYRNNVLANFTASLRSSFPAIWRLVGEEYFGQIARDFHRLQPSRSGDLLHVGELFPGYLNGLHAADDYRYLADVARLEWLYQESLLAAEHAPLDLERLRSVDPALYESLRFQLHPTLRLFESPFPALRIWQANVASDAEPEIIDLASGADRLSLMRRRLELDFHHLSRGEFCFLNALREGAPVGEAIARASACDLDFDASATLHRFVAAEAIVDFCAPLFDNSTDPRI